jgi:predicted NUDIX family NTP pyrophosphohydrolase
MGKKKSKRDRISAGLLMYRLRDNQLEVFLAHPGGPYFRFKDEGHWTIPKGETNKGEELLETAIREFSEEVGLVPHGPYIEIGSITQKGGKIVHGWAFEGDHDEATPHICNTFKMEWPPMSGHFQEFPEVDRVAFFGISDARAKLKETQWDFVERLMRHLGLR